MLSEKKNLKFFTLDFPLYFRFLLTFKPLFIYKKTLWTWIHHIILQNQEFSPSDLNLNNQFSWSSKRSKCLSHYQKTRKIWCILDRLPMQHIYSKLTYLKKYRQITYYWCIFFTNEMIYKFRNNKMKIDKRWLNTQ